MTFVLLTLVIMGASIFALYKLTNYFGLRMSYKSLILCAVMAIAVNIATVYMSPFLTQEHFVRLALMVFAAAGIVTFYNERLIQQEGAAAVEKPSFFPFSKAKEEPEEEDLGEPTPLEIKLKLNFTSVEEKPAAEAEPLKTEKAVAKKQPQAKHPAAVQPKNAAKPKANAVSKDSGKPVDTDAEAPKKKAATAPTHRKQDAPKESAPKELAPKEIASKETAPKQPEKPEASELPAREEALAAIAEMTSLDDILDYAYEQRAQGKVSVAVEAYQAALERYREDAYAPFIVIDLGNIYKEQAAYEDAIHAYEAALKLPAIVNDDATREEFDKNLSYLRIVEQILSKHHALKTPFQKIPEIYRKEIETTFQTRRAKHTKTMEETA